MTRTTEFAAYKGRGPMRFAPKLKPDNLQRLGQNSQLSFSMTTSEEVMQDWEGKGGGAAETDSSISAVTIGLNLLQRTANTQALALRGTVHEAPSAEQADEAHHAYTLGLTLLDYNPDPLETFTVTENGGTWGGTTGYLAATLTTMAAFVTDGDHIYECTVAGTSGASEPTWPTDGSTVEDGTVTWTDRGDVSSIVVGTDYEISQGGATFAESGVIMDGMPVKFTYTPHANQAHIEALKDAGSEYRLVFDGMNRVKDNRPCVIECRRAKFNPTEGTDYISDTFGEMPITAVLLKDESISADAELSQYFSIRWQDAA